MYLDLRNTMDALDKSTRSMQQHARSEPNMPATMRVELSYPCFSRYRVGSGHLLRRRDSLLVRGLHRGKSIELLDVSINGRILVKRLESWAS